MFALPGHRASDLRTRRPSALRIEALEARTLLSTAELANLVALPAGHAIAPNYDPNQAPGGYWPAQVRHAYGFDQLTATGSGQTIAIVDAFDDPNISRDLATFDAQYGLAAPPSFIK